MNGTRKPPRLGSPLSEREHAVLERVSRGDTNPQIGRALSISHDTVKTHVGRIMGKLGARTRVDAVRIAIQQGLLPGYHGPDGTSAGCDSTLNGGAHVCARKGTHAIHGSPDGKYWADNVSDQTTASREQPTNGPLESW